MKVQPKARRPGLHGAAPAADGPRLRIAVAEAAEDGCANRAACGMLADALAVAPSAVRVTVGATSRQKVLHVSGDSATLAARLATL